MDFKKLNKKILVLVLVLIIVVAGIFSRINPVKFALQLFNRVNLFRAQVSPELLPSEEISEEPLAGAEEESPVEMPKEEAEAGTQQLSLEEIQEEINRIRGEVEEVRQKVNKLEALTEIQKEINNIKKETELVRQEVNKLRNLNEIQEKIDEISEKTTVLTNVLTAVPIIKEIPG